MVIGDGGLVVTPGMGVGGGIVIDSGTGTSVTPVVTPTTPDDSEISVYSGEYVADNNQRFASLEQTTFFTAPGKLTLPLGGTMRLALPVTTTKQRSIPQVEAAEIKSDDGSMADTTNMGVLCYNMGASNTGSDGFLVLSPASQGSGIIRVKDTATGTFTDIAYTVTEAGSGVNGYKDNDRFAWYDKTGKEIEDPNQTTAANSDWYFVGNLTAWGDANQQDNPYLSDLSWGKKNAYFTFDTLAEKFTLTLYGKVQITVTDINGDPIFNKTLSANGGEDSAAAVTADLGKNPKNETRHVKVTVLSETAAFDRLLEQYAGNQPILPDTAADAPQIYFGRTLPDTGTVKTGPVTIPVYVVDANGVSAVVVTNDEIAKNTSPAKPKSERLYNFDLKVTGNGVFTIKAVNSLSKTSEINIMVDWFNQKASTLDAPLTMTRAWQYEGSSRTISDTDQLQKGEKAFLAVTTNPDTSETLTVTKTLFYYAVTKVTTTTAYELKELPAEDGEGTQWVILKTVTRTDEDGTLLEDPQITQEPAENGENTVLPTGNTVTQIRGEWQEVKPDANGRFPVTVNGIYRLSAEASDGRSATELFRVDRLNDTLPTVILTQPEAEEGSLVPQLSFTANKGATSASGLDTVTLGAYTLRSAFADDITRLSGTFPAPYSGKYTVTDKADNQNSSNTVKIDQALAAPADAITTVAATNNDKSNGSVIVHANRLLGGSRDEISEYGIYNGYQAVLVPAAEDFDQCEGKDFGTFAKELTWTSVVAVFGGTGDDVEFKKLTPGVYVLYLRDASDTNTKWQETTLTQDDCLILRLTVNDGSVNFTTQRSGQDLTVNATGAENYDYLLFPAKDGKLTDYDQLDAIIQASQQAENDRAQATYEEAKKQANEELPSAKTALSEAQKTLADAQAALDALNKADPTEEEAIKAAEAAVAEAQADVDEAQAKVSALNKTINSTKTDYWNADNVTAWQTDNTYLDLSYGTYQITVRDSGDTSRYLSRLVTLAPPASQGELTEKQEKDIIQRNQTEDVAVEGKDSTVILPKGLLKDGDSVNALLLTAPKTGFTPGTVVTVTVNGETRILPWCAVTADGRLLYLATERGAYGLTENAKAFTDTVAYWAEDDIAFTSARELFRGTTDTTFSPDRTMTRAMFVTVLGRMAGVEETAGTASRFTDVPADFWCAAYVNWAAENGIIDGYADGSFRPNAPVQREQMAKILRNFAKYLGENVDAKGSLARYTDRSSVSAWAVDPCIWATDSGLLQGRQDGRLDPHGQATRAQASAVLHRYVEHILTQRLADAETLP